MERTETFPQLLVSALTVSLRGAALFVSVEDVEQLHVHVQGPEKAVKAMRVLCRDDQLIITQSLLTLPSGDVSPLQVQLRLPSDWKGAVTLKTASGAIRASGLTGTDLLISTVSGDVSLSGTQSITTTLRSVTGSVKGSDLQGERLRLRTIFGDAALGACLFSACRLQTGSGQVDLELLAPCQQLSCTAGSGSMRLFLPMEELGATLRTLRGKLRLQGVINHPDAPPARFASASGEIEINCSLAATYEEE